MAQHLEVVLKRDFASGWRHTMERVRALFAKTPKADPKETTQKVDWKERAGKNWYY